MYTNQRDRLLNMLYDVEEASTDSEKLQLIIELLKAMIWGGNWD
ncbi:MAG: hypothetical protein P4N59_29500 [Negativicutes bacterium]|nr:hypothetical protein [Negativicutes bacterium]